METHFNYSHVFSAKDDLSAKIIKIKEEFKKLNSSTKTAATNIANFYGSLKKIDDGFKLIDTSSQKAITNIAKIGQDIKIDAAYNSLDRIHQKINKIIGASQLARGNLLALGQRIPTSGLVLGKGGTAAATTAGGGFVYSGGTVVDGAPFMAVTQPTSRRTPRASSKATGTGYQLPFYSGPTQRWGTSPLDIIRGLRKQPLMLAPPPLMLAPPPPGRALYLPDIMGPDKLWEAHRRQQYQEQQMRMMGYSMMRDRSRRMLQREINEYQYFTKPLMLADQARVERQLPILYTGPQTLNNRMLGARNFAETQWRRGKILAPRLWDQRQDLTSSFWNRAKWEAGRGLYMGREAVGKGWQRIKTHLTKPAVPQGLRGDRFGTLGSLANVYAAYYFGRIAAYPFFRGKDAFADYEQGMIRVRRTNRDAPMRDILDLRQFFLDFPTAGFKELTDAGTEAGKMGFAAKHMKGLITPIIKGSMALDLDVGKTTTGLGKIFGRLGIDPKKDKTLDIGKISSEWMDIVAHLENRIKAVKAADLLTVAQGIATQARMLGLNKQEMMGFASILAQRHKSPYRASTSMRMITSGISKMKDPKYWKMLQAGVKKGKGFETLSNIIDELSKKDIRELHKMGLTERATRSIKVLGFEGGMQDVIAARNLAFDAPGTVNFEYGLWARSMRGREAIFDKTKENFFYNLGDVSRPMTRDLLDTGTGIFSSLSRHIKGNRSFYSKALPISSKPAMWLAGGLGASAIWGAMKRLGGSLFKTGLGTKIATNLPRVANIASNLSPWLKALYWGSLGIHTGYEVYQQYFSEEKRKGRLQDELSHPSKTSLDVITGKAMNEFDDWKGSLKDKYNYIYDKNILPGSEEAKRNAKIYREYLASNDPRVIEYRRKKKVLAGGHVPHIARKAPITFGVGGEKRVTTSEEVIEGLKLYATTYGNEEEYEDIIAHYEKTGRIDFNKFINIDRHTYSKTLSSRSFLKVFEKSKEMRQELRDLRRKKFKGNISARDFHLASFQIIGKAQLEKKKIELAQKQAASEIFDYDAPLGTRKMITGPGSRISELENLLEMGEEHFEHGIYLETLGGKILRDWSIKPEATSKSEKKETVLSNARTGFENKMTAFG